MKANKPILVICLTATFFLMFLVKHASAQAPIKLISDGFENGTAGWDEFTNIVTTEKVHSGTHSAKYNGYPGATKSFGQNVTEVYFRLWLYFPSGFNWSVAGGRHFWRLTNAQGSYWQNRQIDSQPNGPRQVSLPFFIGTNGASVSPAGGYILTLLFPEDKWFLYEFHIKLNTPGQSNGLAEVWIDGVSCPIQLGWGGATVPRVQNANFNWDLPFNMLRMNTNFDNCNTVCYWYTDDMEVWNGCPPGSPCNTSTGINNSGTVHTLSIFPNPANTAIKIQTDLDQGKTSEIKIYNMLGKEIFSKQINASDELIDTSDLPNGVYLIKSQTEDKIATQKFIVQH
jgi:hypothetical protein